MIDWVAPTASTTSTPMEHGDPHSPHLDHAMAGAASQGLVRHIGWVFSDMEVADEPATPRICRRPLIRFVDRTFVVWVVVGLVAAFGLGSSAHRHGRAHGAAMGGAAHFFMHHATFSINSVCHYFGRADYDTGDESKNVFWLAIPTWGEAWHNNHHAFPTSYRHGLRRWQLDPSAGIIRALEMTGLAWDVVRVDPARRERTLAVAQG